MRLRTHPAADEWDELVRLYTEPLFRFARSKDLPASDAHDLVQDIFVVLVREMPQFEYDPSRSFTAWRLTVARRKIIDHWKKPARQVPLADHDPAVEGDPCLPT